jgi:hypothetical protein
MPVSEQQKKTACLALGIKEGKVDGSKFKVAAEMAKSMSEEKLREWCNGPLEKS